MTAGWELLGYGPDQVVRIEFAQGRIVRTAVPPLLSNGPLSFVVGPSQVIIRPLDLVPGYLVPDGHLARGLTGVLSHGGTLIPGPRPGTAWFQGRFPGQVARAGPDGRHRGPGRHCGFRAAAGGRCSRTAGATRWPSASAPANLYDVTPRGVRRIAGMLAAVGPASWLIMQCQAIAAARTWW